MALQGGLVAAGGGAGDGRAERPALVESAGGAGQGPAGELQIAPDHLFRQAQASRDLGGGGQEGGHPAGRQGGREVVERPRLGGHLGGDRPPGGGQAAGQLFGFGIAVHSEEDPPRLGRIGERLGGGLGGVERAGSRSRLPQSI